MRTQRDLKGHGFSHADQEVRKGAALAAEGMPVVKKKNPRRLKPMYLLGHHAARLKSCPEKNQDWKFNKQSLIEICGLPPISQSTRKGRGMERFHRSAGRLRRWATVTRLFSVSALLMASLTPALAQSAPKTPPRTSPSSAALYRIAGTIVNAASGEPIRRATVAVLSEEDSHTVAAVESDSQGHFALARLPAAKYQLTASKRGFHTAFYDEHDDYNSAVVTGPDQDTGNLTFRLVPGAVLRGVVSTDGGDPVENARVMLFLKSHDGKPAGRVAQADSVSTDDTGAYEFSNLAAGEYMLAVAADPWYAMHRASNFRPGFSDGLAAAASSAGDAPPSSLDVVYPVTYFDSTTDEASATHIVLSGGSRQQADITLHATPSLHIQVDTPRKQDGSIARAELRQTVFGTVIGAESAGFLDSMQTGTTEFTSVAPGHYQLAQGDPPRLVDLDATSNLQVDPALGTATVSVSGTLRNPQGAAYSDDCSLILLAGDSTLRQNPMPAVCMKGAFTFPSVPPGEWQLAGDGGGRQLAIGSITTGSRTLAGNLIHVQDRSLSLVVNLSQGATQLTGFARRDGKGAAGVMVVLVPRQLAAMDSLVRRDQSDSDGSFSLRNVVPGQYTVVAIQDGWSLDWAEPHVIARYLPGGVPVTVSDTAGKLTTLAQPVPVQAR